MDQLSIPRPFSHQPMLARDPTSTGQQGEGLSRDSVIRFGRFRVLPRARKLLVDGRPVELGSRAFDLLMVLIRSPGILLTKNEIVSRVWPDVVVEENNLKVQMSALRKVLNRIGTSSKHSTGVAMCLSARSPQLQSSRMHSCSPSLSVHRPEADLCCGQPVPLRSMRRRDRAGQRSQPAGDIDRQPHVVLIAGKPPRLTPTFWRLCTLLYRHRGDVVENNRLHAELYGDIEQPMANAVREHLRRQKGAGRIEVRDHQPFDPGYDLIITDVPGSGTTVQM